MSEELDAKIKKQGLNKGLILGIILGVLSILSFYFMTTMTTSMVGIVAGPVLFSMVIPVVLAILFSRDLRKNIGGFWSFKQAVTGIFVMFVVAYVVSYLMYGVLFAKVIEPDLISKTEQVTVTAMTNMMEKSNANQEAMDKALDDVHQKFEEQKTLSIGKQIQSFVTGLIFVFVLALIFAAVLKKERPVYLTDDNGIEPTV